MESEEMERSDSLNSDSVEIATPISLCHKLSNDPTTTHSLV